MEINNTLQNIPKYTQALCNDAVLFFSGVDGLATPERKTMVKATINIIKNELTKLEHEISK